MPAWGELQADGEHGDQRAQLSAITLARCWLRPGKVGKSGSLWSSRSARTRSG